MKRLLVLGAGVVFAASALPAFGSDPGDTGTVQAQVTVAAPCITVSPAAADFGLLTFSTAAANSGENETLAITNCGVATETILGRGTDAHGPSSSAAWSLSGDHFPPGLTGLLCDGPGPVLDRFGVAILDGTGLDLAGTALTTTNQPIAFAPGSSSSPEIGPGVTKSPRAVLLMPCSGSSGAGETMTFELVFTATL